VDSTNLTVAHTFLVALNLVSSPNAIVNTTIGGGHKSESSANENDDGQADQAVR
jgi:hypothetical protein